MAVADLENSEARFDQAADIGEKQKHFSLE